MNKRAVARYEGRIANRGDEKKDKKWEQKLMSLGIVETEEMTSS